MTGDIESGSDQPINYGGKPISNDGFAVELRCVKEDKDRKFVILNMETRYGNAGFILLPEEAKVLADVLMNSIKGIELNQEYIPESKTIDSRREMFPDI